MSAENGSALAVNDHPPTIQTRAEIAPQYHERAVQAANFVRAIVLGKAVQIGPRKYVPVDAYQAIANAMGCVASARDVRKVDGGWTAIGEVKRLSDGKILSEGEGFVGMDEPKWSKGPEYAARSMVQTRAIGRACRAAFAFVVPMIDLNLQPTPAEEMEGVNVGTETPPAPVRGNAAVKAALRPSPPLTTPAPRGDSPPPHTDADFRPTEPAKPAHTPTSPPAHNRESSFGFGKSRGVILADLDEGSLKFYEGCLRRDLADASKSQWHEKTRDQLGNLQAEIRYRGLAT